MPTNKVYSAEIKAFGDDGLGQFEFYASVFGNVDKYGDVTDAKAFDQTLEEDFRAKNKRLPITFAHALMGGNVPGADPHAFIGWAEANDMVADDHGLRIKAQLDMENPYAVQVHRLMKLGLVDQASFSFGVEEEKAMKDGSRLIKRVKLYEAGPCLVGVNGETEVLAVKTLTSDPVTGTETHDEADEHRAAEELAMRAKAQTDIAFGAARLRLMQAEIG